MGKKVPVVSVAEVETANLAGLPLEATVALYRDGVKALETAPLRVTEGLEPRSKAVPVRLTVPLGGLAPGVYDCEVSVVDTVGQKVTFWRTPVVLVP